MLHLDSVHATEILLEERVTSVQPDFTTTQIAVAVSVFSQVPRDRLATTTGSATAKETLRESVAIDANLTSTTSQFARNATVTRPE